MRLIHQACITSRSDFGAEIWWQGQKNLETTLQLQQNAALRRILNAFCSTPVTGIPDDSIHCNGNPPPAFATTSTETIEFSIGFGFTALIYVSL
jgi:hypothetical protein